jgi:phenylpropionate dioxygenase-like ring-hydroxylating dioxygenase large terminal subunit
MAVSETISKLEESKRDIALRLRAQLANGAPDMAPSTMRVDASIYTDQDHFERELATLFTNEPFFVGLSVELPDSGSFKTVKVGRSEIIVIRQKDGSLKAFHNACIHRGMKLVDAESGRTPRIICPYHAWSYGTDGSLLAMPNPKCFGSDEVVERELVGVGVGEAVGLMFARLGNKAPVDVRAHLGAMYDEIEEMKIAEMRPSEVHRDTWHANWKLGMDGYCEGYHFDTVHPQTLGGYAVSNAHAVDYFGWNVREAFCLVPLKDMPADEVQSAEIRNGEHLILIYLFFPNMVMATIEGGVSVVSMLPGEHAQESRFVELRGLRRDLPPETAAMVDAQLKFTYHDVTFVEDRPVAYATNEVLNSGAIKSLVFGRNEAPLQHFHRGLAERISKSLT